MSFHGYNRILALGAHPDDIESGCAGFISRSVDSGAEVYFTIMSRCDDQFTEEEKGQLLVECQKSAEILGVKTEPEIYDLPNRELPKYMIEIIDIFNRKQSELKPDLILIPSLEDPHQDHEAVAKSAIRTFRGNETILQYEILRHGSHSFTPSLFVDISKYLIKKMDAIDCYKSQISRRKYFDRECFKGLAKTRGAQSGYDYAEGFVVYKLFW